MADMNILQIVFDFANKYKLTDCNEDNIFDKLSYISVLKQNEENHYNNHVSYYNEVITRLQQAFKPKNVYIINYFGDRSKMQDPGYASIQIKGFTKTFTIQTDISCGYLQNTKRCINRHCNMGTIKTIDGIYDNHSFCGWDNGVRYYNSIDAFITAIFNTPKHKKNLDIIQNNYIDSIL